MPTCRLLSLLSGLALLVVPTAAQAAPATVTVQVESKVAGSLLAPTTLTTTAGDFSKDGDATHLCSKTSAAGALEQATTNWTSDYGSFGYSVIGIGGEEHPFSGPDYWALYVNGVPSSSGACTTELQTGDKVLYAPSCVATDAGRCFTGNPLALTAPTTVKPGAAFEVGAIASVTTYDADFNATTAPAPAAGAIVSGADAGATTDAQGKATVTLTKRGPAELVVRGGDNVPDRRTVCVTDGADGFCGTTAPAAPGAPAAPAAPATPAPVAPAPVAPCTTRGDDGLCGTTDERAPVGKLTGLTNGRTYKTGPRTIAGSVGEASGLKEVRLRLTRNDRGKCSQYSFRLERFTARRTCSTASAPLVSIGNRATFSYQLPSALGRGRYVLDVIAVDSAGNADHLVRGRTRVVFRVG